MIGDEMPDGTAIFHLTFLSGPNSTGGFWPSATPEALGPRKRDQAFSPAEAAVETDATRTSARKFFMGHPWVDGRRRWVRATVPTWAWEIVGRAHATGRGAERRRS